jgi:cyclopropane fatty-acyl-phospholipid synthase-like methyltransferase
VDKELKMLAMKSNIRKWIEQDGEKFLEGVGIKKGQSVLDFGSGEGHYTIPASKIVGANAKVYAVDKDKNVLDKLKRKLEERGIINVELINKKTQIPLDENTVDVVLCYDIIHLVGKNDSSTVRDRIKLYEIVRRIARKGALFSVYPTHLATHTEITSNQEIKKEIEKTGFRFEREIHTELIHDGNKVKGLILNFRKR